MLKLGATRPDGKKILLIGLSAADVESLKQRIPIWFAANDCGFEDGEVLLCHDETETAILKSLADVGIQLPTPVSTDGAND